MTRVVDLRPEHLTAPYVVDTPRPRLSWRLVDTVDGERQTGYEIHYAPHARAPRRVRHDGDETVLQRWSDGDIGPRERVDVRVRAWTSASDEPTPWSAPITIERTLTANDWTSDFVSPSLEAQEDEPRPAFLLRAEFDVPADVVGARAYVTAHGVADLEVNGCDATDSILSPGWTSYDHRLVVETLDLRRLLTPGRNALGVWLADGWYRGRLGFGGGLWNVYGNDVSLLLQLELYHADGRRITVPLDWRWSHAPITRTGLYEGEHHDARRHPRGWSEPGFDDAAWHATTVLHRDATVELAAPTGPPVRVVETLRPASFHRCEDGRIRIDVGQNITGKLRVRGRAPRGLAIELHHAEVLEGSELATRPLRTADAIDRYTFAGEGTETWTPRFTLHGFRFAEIVGWPSDRDLPEVEALVVHSDMRRRGTFASSHALLDRFHENVVWSMRDNFVGLPIDCPQRDERLGWTGDVQVFAPAAAFLYDVTGVLQSWLRDLADEQRDFGSVRSFHPWVDCGFPADPAAGWGDAAVIVPWTLFERTGDLRILADALPSMTAWVDEVTALADQGHWRSGFQLGDWLDPRATPERPGDSATDPYLVATAYHAYTAALLARACRLLGDEERTVRYEAVAARARAAFRHEYVTPSGRIVADSITSLAMAITFGLLSCDELPTAGQRLRALVEEADHRVMTGFLGTPLVCDALVRTGFPDTAYHLLLQTACPSWLYPVTMGATTVWERWDSMLPDGSINPGEMTSFNHYALGAVADFLHRTVAGLAPAEPGYRRIRVAPVPGGGLTHARASHQSPYGPVTVSWHRRGTLFELDVRVPPGTSAEVIMPGGSEVITLESGAHQLGRSFRAAADDPPMPRRWNIHDPLERAEMERLAPQAAKEATP